MSYISYTHIDSSIQTVDDFLNTGTTTFIVASGTWTKIEMFAYGTDGLLDKGNLESIYFQYSDSDQDKFSNDYQSDLLVVEEYLSRRQSIELSNNRETQLESLSSRLKINQLDIGTLLGLPYRVLDQEVPLFQTNQVVKQETFKEFFVDQLRILEEDKDYRKININLDGGFGKIIDELPEVTAWLWSRSLSGVETEEEQATAKLINISPYILSLNTSVAENGGSFNISLQPISGSYSNGKWNIDKNTQVDRNQIQSVNLHKDNRKGERVRNNFYFHNVIQENDLVFIRFETLKNELTQSGSSRIRLRDKEEISLSELVKGNYDMIGLVDQNAISVNSFSNDVTIDISGRDLMKLLIEDGTYFFPLEFIPGGVFVDNEDHELSNKRVDGKLYLLSTNIFRTVEFTLKFIFSALSNISICPNYLFNSYKNGTEIQGKDENTGEFILKENVDIRSKRFELDIDENVVENEDGEIEVFDNVINITEDPMPGIWQIINIVIDESVEQYRIVDATLGNELGSIINAINKNIQKPFMEFYSDTYGNKFYFMVRRPPFDQKAYKDLASVAIEIEDSDVFIENLQFTPNQAYSWYRLTPQGSIDELGADVVWAYLKAVRFREYADIFGDKCLDITNNYIWYQNIVGKNEEVNINSVTRQYVRDLKYLIETNQYNPFTRSGQITINGDRRIKRGTVIYYKPTEEYFYVEAVSQSYSINKNGIDRVTVLQVSHGMVARYIDRYFNIIETPIDDEETFLQNPDVSAIEFVEGAMSNWKVNADNFDFFLRKQQFAQ